MTPTEATPTSSPPAPPRRRRLALRIALVVAVVLVALRVALPSIVESLIESEGAKALGVEVEVDNIDLVLLEGDVLLEGLRIGGVSMDGEAAPDDLLRLERASIHIAWIESLTNRPTLERLRFEAPRIRMRRLADGSLDVARLGSAVPNDEAAGENAENKEDGGEASSTDEPLALELVSLVLEDLDFELQDASAAEAPPIQLAIDEIDLTGARIEGGHFSLEGFELDAAQLDLGPFGRLALGVNAALRDFSTKGGTRFPAELRVTFPEAETTPVPALGIEGEIGLEPLSFEGRIESRDLPLPELARAAQASPYAAWLSSGDVDAALTLRLDSSAPGQRTIEVNGRVAIDELDIENSDDPDAREIAVAWKQLDVDLREARVQLDAAGALTAPPFIRLAGVTLDTPRLLFTQGGSALQAEEEIERQTVEELASEAEEAVEEIDVSPRLQLDFVKIVDGRFEFADYTTKPRFRETFENIQLEATRIDPVAITVSKLDFALDSNEGKLVIRGGVGSEQALEIDLDDFELAPFNAYALTHAGYVIQRGRLNLKSKIQQKRDGLDAQNALTLQDLAVKEARDGGGFEQQFGMPLPMALALLRDQEGKIALDIPIVQKDGKTDVGLTQVVLKAVRTAFKGALTSPLKFVSAMVPGGDDEAADPLIAFEPKSDALPENTSERLTPIANLLAQRPTLAISLRGQVGSEDGTGKVSDLDALARARAERIRTLLIETHAVAAAQIVIDPQVPVTSPGVALALVPKPMPKPAKNEAATP